MVTLSEAGHTVTRDPGIKIKSLKHFLSRKSAPDQFICWIMGKNSWDLHSLPGGLFEKVATDFISDYLEEYI